MLVLVLALALVLVLDGSVCLCSCMCMRKTMCMGLEVVVKIYSDSSFTPSYSAQWCNEHFIHVKAMRKVSCQRVPSYNCNLIVSTARRRVDSNEMSTSLSLTSEVKPQMYNVSTQG